MLHLYLFLIHTGIWMCTNTTYIMSINVADSQCTTLFIDFARASKQESVFRLIMHKMWLFHVS